MARLDGIVVLCQVPTEDIKDRHSDIRNEYRSFLSGLSEAAAERKLRVYAPYITEDRTEYRFREFGNIEHMVFYNDAVGLDGMCRTANSGSALRRMIGRRRAVMAICNGHDEMMNSIIADRMGISSEEIVEVMLDGGEFGFDDAGRIVDTITGRTAS